MHRKTSFKYRGKKISIGVEDCNTFGKFRGLMFRRKEEARALLFDFKRPVSLRLHSLFVFFPFIAVWIDGRGKVIGARKIPPFSFSAMPKKPFRKIIEIPDNTKYKKEITGLMQK